MGDLAVPPAYAACVHRDVLEVLGGGKGRGRAGMGHRQTWLLCCLCYIIWVLGGPELFVLFASEALVVVAFALEQLLIVGFTVKFTLKSCEGAKAEFGVTVLAAEACWMEDQVVGNQSLHWVDRLVTWWTHFLLGLKAERLRSLDRFLFSGVPGVHLRVFSAALRLITRRFVHSLSGGGYSRSHSLLWQALLQTLVPVPVSFSAPPPLRFTSLGFPTERFFFFFCSRQDVARYWSASAPDAFTGCRTSHNCELNKGCHCRRQITYMLPRLLF